VDNNNKEEQERGGGEETRKKNEDEEEEERELRCVVGHRVTASYLYSQPLSMTPWWGCEPPHHNRLRLKEGREKFSKIFRGKLDFFFLAAGYSATSGCHENQLIRMIVR
jgi:hypothetical protein